MTVAELTQRNAALEAQVAELRPRAERASELERENLGLQHELAWFRRYFMARRSDKLTPEEQQLPFDEAEVLAEGEDSETLGQADTKQPVSSYSRERAKRKPLPKDLPRVEEVLDIHEEEKSCACGSTLNRIGEEISERLDIIPPRVRVIRTVRPKYACRSCEGSAEESKPAVRSARPRPQLIPGGIATAGLIAHIVTSKFVDGLPLYRQEKQFSRIGVELSRRTMADWMITAAQACDPLLAEIDRLLRSGPVMLLDETSCQVMREPDKSNTSTSYAWTAYGGPVEHPIVRYRYP